MTLSLTQNGRSGRADLGKPAMDQRRQFRSVRVMSAYPPKATEWRTRRDVGSVPCVDGSELARASSRKQHWSVQPCVRPFGAVHMTAGHNALRGSGPDQKLAFDNAVAQVGCPDRWIDRLCITCCSPSQPSHHAGWPARSRLRRKCNGFLVSLALGHHGPDHPRNLVGECDGGNLIRPPRQTRPGRAVG